MSAQPLDVRTCQLYMHRLVSSTPASCTRTYRREQAARLWPCCAHAVVYERCRRKLQLLSVVGWAGGLGGAGASAGCEGSGGSAGAGIRR
jgi:hypothetical protein